MAAVAELTGTSMRSTPTIWGVSGFGAGGGGAVPLTPEFEVFTMTSGVSLITVAETFMPFLRWKTDCSLPSIMNF